MDQIRWKTIEDIYHGAVELRGDRRQVFLDSSCGEDDSLRDEVESLLAESDEEPSFFSEPAFSLGLSVLADQELEDMTGKVLGQYRIVKQIGRGGMGAVYLAEDLRLDRQVAIKLLPAYLAAPRNIDRFRHEARSASAISHPNVAHIYDINESNGRPFIAMEFVEGKTLRERLCARTLTFGEAVDIGSQVAFALSAAHAAGIVHRDVKPENIIVRQDGLVKVVDFGLAKLTEPVSNGVRPDRRERTSDSGGISSIHTEPGLLIGTANYMSPEQARGLEIDDRTDIWSWGVVFYEMLAGEAPFSGATNSDIIASILTKEPVVDRGCFPGSIRAILVKSICKDPASRYDDISDVVAALRKLKLDHEGSELWERRVPLERFDGGNVSLSGMIEKARAWYGWRYAWLIAFTFIVLGGVIGHRYFGSASSTQIGSIAVMPFVNEGGNAEVEYLSDGMTDALIKTLSQLPDLSVKARSTVFSYKGKELSPRKLGEELNVQAVLLGRFANHGNAFLLNLELVNTQTQDVIWCEQYDRRQSDLFTLQTDIAHDVSSKLRIRLSDADRQRLSKTYTNNPVAYTNYLLGRFYWNKRTGNDLRKSVEYFEAAIALDPDFALAYAGIADSYMLFPSYAGAMPSEVFPKAEAAARKALELDESLAEAHTSLSFAYFNYDWRFEESDEQIRRAIALNPNYSTAYHWYGNANLLAEGHFNESIDALRKAHELDPLSLIISADLATSYLYALRIDEAIDQYHKTLEMDNSFYYAHLNLGRAYLLKGDLQHSLDELQKASGFDSDPRIPMLRSRIYSKMGHPSDARRMLDQLKQMQRVRYVSNCNFAVVYAGLGETDLAFASLESAFKAHDANLIYLKTDPLLANLHGDCIVDSTDCVGPSNLNVH